MRSPEDFLRRAGRDLKVSNLSNTESMGAAEVFTALTRMPKAEAISALDELEPGIEIERLRKIWDATYAEVCGGEESKAAMAELRPHIDAITIGVRTSTGEARKRWIKQAKSLAHRLTRMQQEERQKVTKLTERIERYDRIAAEVNRFLNGPLKLERLESSHFRRLLEAEREGGVFTSIHKGREAEFFPPDMIDLTYGQSAVFVVEHDWARAFESAPDVFNGPVTLPDTACIFEFCISGHIVVAAIGQIDDNPSILPFIRTKDGWVTIGSMISRHGQIGTIKALDGNNLSILIHEAGDGLAGTFMPLREEQDTHRLYTLIDRQVRAVGVALDAKVAIKNAVRMPYKSNQLPKGQAKPKPFYSYHTVSLARRAARLEAREDDGLQVTGTKRRLHFRRGHWRHFDGWKTWVNWCLVGDPDLGFVDKHYKL